MITKLIYLERINSLNGLLPLKNNTNRTASNQPLEIRKRVEDSGAYFK